MKKALIIILVGIVSILLVCFIIAGFFIYKNTHLLTFESNGGDVVDSQKTLLLMKLPETTRKGYSFCGWYLDEGYTQKAEAPMFFNKDTTLYALWQKNKYSVEFVENGGSLIADMEIDFLTECPRTVKSGYLFNGWYYDAELTSIALFPVEVNEKLTLYAKWRKSYTVKFNTNGGVVIPDMSLCEIKESPKTEKSGYRFKGWYLDSQFKDAAEFPMVLEKNISLYALWEEIVYLVNFETNGGSAIATRETGKIESSPVTYRDGYTFVGWYKNPALTEKASFPLKINENITLYAKWEKTKYTVNFVTNGGSSISTLYTNRVEAEPYLTKPFHLFDGWYLDAELSHPAYFPMDIEENTVLYAKWLLAEKTISFSDCKIKYLDNSFYSGVNLNISPTDFDLPTLAAKGYTITITVSYDVHYVKDFTGIGDIGYLGSPKYEVDFLVSDSVVKSQHDLGTSTVTDRRTISYNALASYFYGKNVKIRFSTDNIQNQVHIEDIVVTYKCVK